MQEPILKGFRGGIDAVGGTLAGGGLNEVTVNGAIGTIRPMTEFRSVPVHE